MILTVSQQDVLADLIFANTAFKPALKDAVRAGKALTAELTAVENFKRDRLIRACVEAGIPKRQVGISGLGSSSPSTILESLARSAVAGAVPTATVKATVSPVSGKHDPFGPDPERFTPSLADAAWFSVELFDRELSVACKAAGWSMEDATANGLNSAVFYLSKAPNGNVFVSAVTTDFMPEYGLRHPVVQWSRTAGNATECLAWALANGFSA